VDESTPPGQEPTRGKIRVLRSDKAGKDHGIPMRTIGNVLEDDNQTIIDESPLPEKTPRKRVPVRPLLPTLKEPDMKSSPNGVFVREWADPGREGERRAFKEPPPPTIEVTIGRVEVQAVHPQNTPQPAPVHSRKEPSLSLDAYLKERAGGTR